MAVRLKKKMKKKKPLQCNIIESNVTTHQKYSINSKPINPLYITILLFTALRYASEKTGVQGGVPLRIYYISDLERSEARRLRLAPMKIRQSFFPLSTRAQLLAFKYEGWRRSWHGVVPGLPGRSNASRV
jgi:hypothetical protein